MSEGPDGRLTLSVGQQEFEQLNREWADYVAGASAGSSPVDPVLTLRRTGGVLRSLDRLLASIGREAPSGAEHHGAEDRESEHRG
ncbi:hypothetical protein [Arthrobacter sp. Y81]|uniref:hypothetical protein n=1 Tax=Arthrobacter sp. Y81 TaxID=2058897 RepID=UPI0011B0A0BF|nr:hypothetical protein [Arthrobacter sp. Y81]